MADGTSPADTVADSRRARMRRGSANRAAGFTSHVIDDQGNSDGTIPRLVALQYLTFR